MLLVMYSVIQYIWMVEHIVIFTEEALGLNMLILMVLVQEVGELRWQDGTVFFVPMVICL